MSGPSSDQVRVRRGCGSGRRRADAGRLPDPISRMSGATSDEITVGRMPRRSQQGARCPGRRAAPMASRRPRPALERRHSELHELVARYFPSCRTGSPSPRSRSPIYGERGVIDILAWHPGRGCSLVIELKTDIADVNELRRHRSIARAGIAIRIAIERAGSARATSLRVFRSGSSSRMDRPTAAESARTERCFERHFPSTDDQSRAGFTIRVGRSGRCRSGHRGPRRLATAAAGPSGKELTTPLCARLGVLRDDHRAREGTCLRGDLVATRAGRPIARISRPCEGTEWRVDDSRAQAQARDAATSGRCWLGGVDGSGLTVPGWLPGRPCALARRRARPRSSPGRSPSPHCPR